MYTDLLLGIILVIVIVLQLGYTSIARVYPLPLLALSYKVTAGKPLLRRQVLWYIYGMSYVYQLKGRSQKNPDLARTALDIDHNRILVLQSAQCMLAVYYQLVLRFHYTYNPCSVYLTQPIPRLLLLCFPLRLRYLLTQVHAVYCIHHTMIP